MTHGVTNKVTHNVTHNVTEKEEKKKRKKKFPLHPKHPERVCWGCDRYCSTNELACGNGSDRTMHPAELLGDDWYTVGNWGL